MPQCLRNALEYIKHWYEAGRANTTLSSIAQYLLRMIEYLNLEMSRTITLKEIESAANLWGSYQSKHPAKRITFSESAKQKFTWYAIDWLKKLDRLEQVPLFNKIFKRKHAKLRHLKQPLLNERICYLQYWADNGAVDNTLRALAQYLLIIMDVISFKEIRIVKLSEIQKASEIWSSSNYSCWKRKSDISKTARDRFISNATGWFKMLGCLEVPSKAPNPFKAYLQKYISYMSEEQGLSENTIKSRKGILQDFLINISSKEDSLMQLTPLIIDDLLIKKREMANYSRRTVQTYASVVRVFLKYLENQGCCNKGLSDAVKVPRVYSHESMPYAPSWEDIKKIIADTESDHHTDIRDYAILMLLSVYGLRCSEVVKLSLEDINWKDELLYLRRAKRCKPQTLPLSKTVGNAILRYLREVRANNCLLREVFLCMRSPYRCLTNAAIYQIVSRKLKPLNLNIKHNGPHALRHACATRLINNGVSLKEISDHLGHQMLDTTRIYTKVDLINLRKVAELELGDLL